MDFRSVSGISRGSRGILWYSVNLVDSRDVSAVFQVVQVHLKMFQGPSGVFQLVSGAFQRGSRGSQGCSKGIPGEFLGVPKKFWACSWSLMGVSRYSRYSGSFKGV